MPKAEKQTRPDLPLVETSPPQNVGYEVAVLEHWDRDIRRAARWRANRQILAGTQADDLAQEARIRVLRVARAYPHAPSHYIRVVIANAVRGAANIDRRFSVHSPEVEYVVDESQVEPTDDIEVADVTRWVGSLPSNLKEIYALIYLEGRTQREAAKLLGVSQPRVAQLHKELVEKTRKALAGS